MKKSQKVNFGSTRVNNVSNAGQTWSKRSPNAVKMMVTSSLTSPGRQSSQRVKSTGQSAGQNTDVSWPFNMGDVIADVTRDITMTSVVMSR